MRALFADTGFNNSFIHQLLQPPRCTGGVQTHVFNPNNLLCQYFTIHRNQFTPKQAKH